jgi:DNA-binding IclR family transcriptional regulator
MLKDLAGAAGMSAAKAHRYLVSFQRLDLVVQDARGRYDLGPAALHLGLALQRLDPVRLARERLPALQAQIPHTLALAVWGNRGPTLVHWEEPPGCGGPSAPGRCDALAQLGHRPLLCRLDAAGTHRAAAGR